MRRIMNSIRLFNYSKTQLALSEWVLIQSGPRIIFILGFIRVVRADSLGCGWQVRLKEQEESK